MTRRSSIRPPVPGPARRRDPPRRIGCDAPHSVGEPVTSAEALSESVATFTAQAATKLRKHGFAAAEPTRPSKLYKAVDALNARYGRGKVFSAAEGIAKPWKMKRGKL